MDAGISVSAWDPYLKDNGIPAEIDILDGIEGVSGFDMVVLATAHPEFSDIDWESLLKSMRTPLLYDGRRVLDQRALTKMGWTVNAVGQPLQD
jgi:UDPglucose 6-dehydrogenase